MWVVIHMCMEAMLGISLYSYLYPKLAKMIGLSYYLLCYVVSSTKSEKKRVEQVPPGRKVGSWREGCGVERRCHKQCIHK
jgi:hypothetical protein